MGVSEIPEYIFEHFDKLNKRHKQMFDQKTKNKIMELDKKYLNKDVRPDESDIQFLIDLAKQLTKTLDNNGEEANYWDDGDKAQIEKK